MEEMREKNMEMNHVLIVEDDKEIREGVEIYLKNQGYEVFQAADGVEGLKRRNSSCDRRCDDAENGWDHNDNEAS